MDPVLTSDGRPYAPKRYRELVNECYLVSRYCNTTYNDVLSMSSLERKYLLEFILEEKERESEARKEAKKKTKSKR